MWESCSKRSLPQIWCVSGLIPEFVGRVPVVVSLNALDRQALVRILTEPKNSLVRQYQALFELDGIELKFEDSALEAIADKSMERKTGARGLRAIMESVLMDIMYTSPSDESISSLYYYKRGSRRKRPPVLEHRELPAPSRRSKNSGRKKKEAPEIA